MRQRPVLWPVLALAAVAAIGTGARAVRADGVTSKTYAEKNFKWSLPAGWNLEDAEGDNKQLGYVCVARKDIDPSKRAAAWVLVVDAGKATLDSLLKQAKDNKTSDLDEPDATPPGKVDWAGVTDARYVQITGKIKGGEVTRAHRVYSAIVDGKLHQLDIRTWNGAEADLMSDLDAVAAGYRVLKGGSTRPTGGGDGAAPEAGEVGDGLSARYDKLGLTWTLPAPKDPKEGFRNFAITARGPADVVPKADTNIEIGRAELQGEGPQVVIEFQIEKANAGGTSKAYINQDRNFEELLKVNFEGNPVPNLDEEVAVGNWRGSMKAFTGKDKANKPLYIRTVFSVLKGTLYVIRVVAHDKGEIPAHTAIGEALAGLKWDDASEGVRGPVVTEFTSVTAVRPDAGDMGKDTVISKLGTFSVKKPAAFGSIRYIATDAGFVKWATAMESRKTGSYMFFGVEKFSDAQLKNSTPPQTLESLIDEHDGAWKNAVTDPVTLTQKAGKANKTAETFRGAKGFRYEFKGSFEDHPFVERGWIVRSITNVLWIRMQFGGKDAETAFATEAKSLVGSLKID